MIGQEIYDLVKKLFPINRSITGDGVRETLSIIKDIIPIEIHEVESGKQVYDWTIPDEWNVKEAYIEDSFGRKVIDIKDHNLHLMSYSEPVNRYIDLDELQDHLYSIPEQPNAIPYRTSYYKRRWGFCIEHDKRAKLKQDIYHVVIDSEFKKDGSMTHADLVLRGKSDDEVFISTYTCHPSMANNELSGPCLATYLAKWLMGQDHYYTYRFVFIPETIGALLYMDRWYWYLKDNVIAGINISCVGDSGKFSYIPTRYGDTISDKAAKNILDGMGEDYTEYSFLDRGSNEKILCAPGFDLPIVNITRSKFNTFTEYHTSLDNLDFVTPEAFQESFDMYCKFIIAVDKNALYTPNFYGEPCLGKRGLYEQTDSNTLPERTQAIKDFLAYVDGSNDLLDISNIIGVSIDKIIEVAELLSKHDIIRKFSGTCTLERVKRKWHTRNK